MQGKQEFGLPMARQPRQSDDLTLAGRKGKALRLMGQNERSGGLFAH